MQGCNKIVPSARLLCSILQAAMTHGLGALAQHYLCCVLWPTMHGMHIDCMTGQIRPAPWQFQLQPHNFQLMGAAKLRLEQFKSRDDLDLPGFMARGRAEAEEKTHDQLRNEYERWRSKNGGLRESNSGPLAP